MIKLEFVFLFSIICLVLSISAIKFTRKLFNPLTIFCGIWSVIFFLSSLQLYDIKQASSQTFCIMAVGVIFYSAGFIVDFGFLKNKRLVFKNVARGRNFEFQPRYKLIYILMIFTLFFTIINARSNIGILLSGGNLDAVLKATRASSADARGTIGNVINNLIVGPFTFAVFPICAYNIANKKHFGLTILALLQLIIGIASSGGRVFLIYLMLLLCVCFTFSSDFGEQIKKRIKHTKKRRFVILIGVFLILFVLLSLSRSGQKIYQHMYLYFTMQPVLFETWADIIDSRQLFGFGEATFNGFTFHILYLIKNIFKVPFPNNWNSIFNIIIEIDTNWMPITNAELPANAYVSAFWYFYLDAREFGVIIFSFLFGVISSLSFKNAIKIPNMKNICIYGMILFAVLDTYVRIRFTNAAYSAGLLLIIFILFKKVKKYHYASD